MRLAFSTITVLKTPYGDPAVASYEARIGPVFREAEHSPGFIDRARPTDTAIHLTNFEREWGSWGRFTTPRFYKGGRVTATDSRASTLSLWRDLASVWTFAHGGMHMYMLRNQAQWTTRMDWKNYAGWWVEDDKVPTWAEAAEKIELINDIGSSPTAFDFRTPFDIDGTPAVLKKVKGPEMISGVQDEH